jgi:hypothetical protein
MIAIYSISFPAIHVECQRSTSNERGSGTSHDHDMSIARGQVSWDVDSASAVPPASEAFSSPQSSIAGRLGVGMKSEDGSSVGQDGNFLTVTPYSIKELLVLAGRANMQSAVGARVRGTVTLSTYGSCTSWRSFLFASRTTYAS